MRYFFNTFVLFYIFLCPNNIWAKSKGLLKEGNIFSFAPPVINQNYYLIEYGFAIDKSAKNYEYNAYVLLSLFEDWLKRSDDLHAGALGFKAGVIMPLNQEIPLSLQLGLGFAKSVLHPNPVFGRSEQTVSKNNSIILEGGLKYKINSYILSVTYQKNSVNYFNRKVFFSFGVNY